MRKKSHIALGRFLIEKAQLNELESHRKAFLIGCILPDCKPSFLTKKHEFNGTYEDVKEMIRNLTQDCNIYTRIERIYWRELGQIIHYIADYFTFPHNITYQGNLKEHCAYEQELKLSLKAYVYSDQAMMREEERIQMNSVEDLFEYIEKKHEEYLQEPSDIQRDMDYILSVCYQVFTSVVWLFNEKLEEVLWPAMA